mmetsp:Transcript_139700/g.243230  ORF Transcript_139700/g.243230 Transcript_139700/m.243230 type:complete len:616 (-) Transcript_139700:137-1984(-)
MAMLYLPASMKMAVPEPVALPPGAVAPRGFAGPPGLNAADVTCEGAAVRPTKLFIGGISRRTTTKQLRDHFSKFGRVLDCVAMRQPDGRPRGFGYVTLDSPVAAERFLREPQVIDDRIVDMKPAVPEASANLAATYGTPKADAAAALTADPAAMLLGMPGCDGLLSAQQAMAPTSMSYPWLEDPGFYCDSGFGGVMVPDIGAPPVGPLSHLGHPVVESSDFVSHLATAPTLMATSPALMATSPASMVPDCLDILTSQKSAAPAAATGPLTGAPGLSLPKSSEPDLAPVKITAASTKPSNVSSVPLGDVTNLLEESARLQELKPSEPLRVETRRPSLAVVSPVGSESADECFVFEDSQAESSEEHAAGSTKPPSPMSSEAVPCDPELLPSIGSAQHALGECRRCNFFAKGRCRNGKDCQFCHLPHERRKLSRQEKREQQAARMARETGSTTEDPDDTDCADEDTADSTPVTTCPTSPVGLSGPLVAPAEPPAATQPAKVLPPGLRPPGLTLPAAPSTGPLLPPHMVRCTPFEPAAFYTGPASTDHLAATLPPPLLATSPLQQPTYIAALPPPLLATEAPAIAPSPVPRPPVKEMCTVSTQTDDDCSWCCHCKEHSH